MTTKPLISIIVPVYNVEEYLHTSLNSIISQTYKNLEIIIVNDGSTDNSGIICDQFANNDNRITVHHTENQGLSMARNYGLKYVNGDFIGFVDSDDWIKPKMFSTLISYALDNKLEVVECSSIDSSETNNLEQTNNFTQGVIESKNSALIRIIKNKRFAVWRRLYRSNIIQNKSFIKNIVYEDVYFTMDVLNLVEKIGFIDVPLYVYNTGNQNSIIRSNYSLKKLNSINAAKYTVLATQNSSLEVKILAKQYLLKFLTEHYNALFENQYLDKNFEHRRKIKTDITTFHSITYFNFFAFIIIVLPFSIYPYFMRINNSRIKIQRKIGLKLRENV